MRMLAKYTDGWALCEDERGKQGVIPAECLKPLRAGISGDQGKGPVSLVPVSNDSLSDLSEDATFPSTPLSTGQEMTIPANDDTQQSANCELAPHIISTGKAMQQVFQELEIGVGNETRLSRRLATATEDISTTAITVRLSGLKRCLCASDLQIGAGVLQELHRVAEVHFWANIIGFP
jgi:hypothetical protein